MKILKFIITYTKNNHICILFGCILGLLIVQHKHHDMINKHTERLNILIENAQIITDSQIMLLEEIEKQCITEEDN